MKHIRRIHLRAALAAVTAVISIGGGAAAYAATRSTATRSTANPIGTGVVVIDTNLAYEDGAAAGTGMVLTSTGEILTNNHVIDGATTIKVVVPNTKYTYTARVVGYDATDDVAVLQLQNASNLKTVTTGDSSALGVGTAVTAIGNAGGTGTLTTTTGTVTGLGKSITVANDSGGTEQLRSVIETNATLEPGDSGGPLLTSSGRVIGMDTAASTGSAYAAYTASDAFAIPIDRALAIATQIEAGNATSTIHIGATAFLGVEVVTTPSFRYPSSASSVTVGGVVANGSAAKAGLTAGDVITAIDGTAVSSQNTLQAAILAHKPGVKATITYTDASGQTQTATATLASGPPQ